MKQIQQEKQKHIKELSERRKIERDHQATPFAKGRRFEVECVHCGHSFAVESHGYDTKEREYVSDSIYFIRNGNAAPVFYEEVPYLCDGCGQPMKIRIKNFLN